MLYVYSQLIPRIVHVLVFVVTMSQTNQLNWAKGKIKWIKVKSGDGEELNQCIIKQMRKTKCFIFIKCQTLPENVLNIEWILSFLMQCIESFESVQRF